MLRSKTLARIPQPENALSSQIALAAILTISATSAVL
jgi:hypothetical protein